MKKVSEHVRVILEEQPFVAEVVREGIGNLSAIARRIRKEVERRAYGKVSTASIVMALHRSESKKHSEWGMRYLRTIKDITVRGNLTLWYIAHRPENDSYLYKKLATLAEKFPGVFCNVIYGVQETMILAHSDLHAHLSQLLSDVKVLEQKDALSAMTVRLPIESMGVPGVYYPILQSLAWEGVSVIEIISVRTEFTVVCTERDVETALRVVRAFTRS